MTIDHDAIAARVWQDRETGTPGVWDAAIESGCHAIVAAILPDGANIIALIGNSLETPERETMRFANARRIAALPDLEAAYLDLHDEVKRLRAEARQWCGQTYTVDRRVESLRAALNEIFSQIDQGGSEGKVFSRDACIAQARAALKGDTK